MYPKGYQEWSQSGGNLHHKYRNTQSNNQTPQHHENDSTEYVQIGIVESVVNKQPECQRVKCPSKEARLRSDPNDPN